MFPGMMKLRPSEIFFSQDSIANIWGKHTPFNAKFIGDTLDELLTESISLRDIPNITSVLINGKFYTVDNRRLWVFRKAEELGFLDDIEFHHVTQRHVNLTKFTTTNGGISIRIRGSGDPGGQIWRTWKPNTFRKVHDNTVSSSAYRSGKIYAIENRTNVNQGYFCTKTVPEYQDPSTYKSSHCKNYYSRRSYRSDDSHSSNFESPVADQEIQLSSIIRPKAENETRKCCQSSLESTVGNNLLDVRGPPVNQSRSSVNPDSFFNKNACEAKHLRTFKSYSDYISVKPDVRSYNEFSGKWDSPASDNKIHRPIIKRSPTEEKQTRSKSSLESISSEVTLRAQDHQSWTNVNLDSFGNKKSYRGSTCNNSDSRVSTKKPYHSSIQKPTAEEEPTRRTTSFESSARKTALSVHGPLVNQSRTNVNQDSFRSKTVAESQHPSTYKSSYCNNYYSRPSYRSNDAHSRNLEPPVSDKEIQLSTIIRSQAEKEATQCSKSYLESSLRKTSLYIHVPHENQSRSSDNQCSVFKKHEAQHPSTFQSYNELISAKPDVRSYKEFSSNCDSPVSDREIHSSIIKRSPALEEPSRRSKSSLDSILDKTSLSVEGHQNRTKVDQHSIDNKTVTEAQHPSAYKPSYSDYISAKPDVRWDNDLVRNCEYPELDKVMYRSSIKRSTAEKEPRLNSKSSLVSTIRKTSPPVQEPLVNQRRAPINQESFGNKTITKAQHPSKSSLRVQVHSSTYILSCSDYVSAKPDVCCENDFANMSDSSVSDKDIHRSSIKESTSEEKAMRRGKQSLESTFRKPPLSVNRTLVNQSTTHVDQHSVGNKTVTEAKYPSTYKLTKSDYISSKPDVSCENDLLGNCKHLVADKEIHYSSIKRSTAEKEQTFESKSSLGSTLRKTSLRVQGPPVNQSRTDVDYGSICNETVTEAQHQSTYKIHKGNISAKPDVRCDNDFLGNYEYSSSSKEIQHSSVKGPTAEKKATLRGNFYFESTVRKTSLRVNIPLVNQITTNVNQVSFDNKTVTESQHSNTYTSSYSKYISGKPDVSSDKDFFGNCEYPVSDKTFHRSSIKRSTGEKEPKRSKSHFGSTIRTPSLRVQGPIVYQTSMDESQYSFCYETITEDQHPSTKKSSYTDNITGKPHVRYANDFLSNCKYPSSDNIIQRVSIKGSAVQNDPKLKNKSSLRSTVRKTLLRAKETVVNQSSMNVNQDSFCYETVTGAQHPDTYKSSYKDNITGKPHFWCDNNVFGNC
ncbi:unnamed protein product [Mytilus coruscus]|uniref:Uncharacterized protein n=1 Tax=Mytilus coruscus TaxID=42192 RepID=A0A6J8CE21_MYTCO|nr:unnamed protein product [Mytilus coruscus]